MDLNVCDTAHASFYVYHLVLKAAHVFSLLIMVCGRSMFIIVLLSDLFSNKRKWYFFIGTTHDRVATLYNCT